MNADPDPNHCSKLIKRDFCDAPDNFFLFVVHYSSPILHKVLVEDLLGGVVVLYHLAVEGRNLLRVDGQSHMLEIKCNRYSPTPVKRRA